MSSFHWKYSENPFSTIYSVARKLKKGSNSFNSFPYSIPWDLIRNDVEKAKANTPIITRYFKLKFPTENNSLFEFNTKNIV